MGLLRRNKPKPNTESGELGEDELPPIDLKPTAFSRDEAQGAMLAAKQLPGYQTALVLLYQALRNRADRILLDYSAQGVAVRYRVDGVWENNPPMDRPTGDAALVVLKKLFGMNANERRARQEGKCGVHIKGVDWIFQCTSQGVPAGERVQFIVEPKKPVLQSLADLGMREKMIETYKGFLNGSGGMVLISGPAGHGLPTTWKISLDSADKFVRDFVSIENKQAPEPEYINVTAHYYDPSTGESPESRLQLVMLKQPDVFVMPSLINDQVISKLLEQIVTENKHCITRIVASDAIEALISLMATHKNHAKAILDVTVAVLNQRLVRRLCDKCRQPFTPSPQLLQKLGIPVGRVKHLYQPFIPPPPDQRVDEKGHPIEIEICKKCNGRGYFGRMALFELLTVTPELRTAIMKQPKPELLRPMLKKLGHLSFQEEGVAAVALHQTSLQELQRVLHAK